jgi:hypothetical protein
VEFACYLFSVGYMMLMEVLGGRQLGLMDLGHLCAALCIKKVAESSLELVVEGNGLTKLDYVQWWCAG